MQTELELNKWLVMPHGSWTPFWIMARFICGATLMASMPRSPNVSLNKGSTQCKMNVVFCVPHAKVTCWFKGYSAKLQLKMNFEETPARISMSSSWIQQYDRLFSAWLVFKTTVTTKKRLRWHQKACLKLFFLHFNIFWRAKKVQNTWFPFKWKQMHTHIYSWVLRQREPRQRGTVTQ